jgi:hypothetical protein
LPSSTGCASSTGELRCAAPPSPFVPPLPGYLRDLARRTPRAGSQRPVAS